MNRYGQPLGRSCLWATVSVVVALLPLLAGAQNCPPNIDFEYGNFDNWTCYIGTTQSINNNNVISLTATNGGGPSFDRHTILPANAGQDFYGGFPMNCPNGSGFTVKLGNETGGGQAEGIAYEFTIPPGQNNYAIIYHYAVVFQDPRHDIHQQPRLEIEAKNMTDNEVIECSSFAFYPVGSLLPGFNVSPIQRDSTDIWYKDWTAVSINLNNRAGKTIRLFFKTADCTFTRHFGYAYIDVDSDCGSEFIGDAYCPGDTLAAITAPYGYQSYTWFNSTFSQTLGTDQTLYLRPPPPPGTVFPVELIPYGGYGCPDTAYAILRDTLVVRSFAGPDTLSCNQSPVTIGGPPKPNLLYEWSPSLGLSNAFVANPRASPATNTQYILSTRSLGGGCQSTDTVLVRASTINNQLTLLGKAAFCITTGDSAVLRVAEAHHIQWFSNNVALAGQNQTRYQALQSGLYHAVLTNEIGCSIATPKQEILIETPRRGISYPLLAAAANEPQQLQARDFAATVLWSPPDNLSNPQTAKPLFTGQEDRRYVIRLETRGGCVTIDTQAVKVYKEINFYVPGAFTPNGDGLNDYLKPIAAGIPNFRYFRVFNRWGQLLFDLRQSPLTGWDGTLKGLPQPMQTVVWMAEGTGVNGKVYKKKGTTILIR